MNMKFLLEANIIIFTYDQWWMQKALSKRMLPFWTEYTIKSLAVEDGTGTENNQKMLTFTHA